VVIAGLLVLAPAAQAGKVVTGTFGSASASAGNVLGGQYRGANGIAVNTSGAGGAGVGDVYVVDTTNNRVQQSSASGTFIRAWGLNAIASGPNDNGTTNFEICTTADVCGTATASAAAGGMSAPQGIAVDPANGNVFVTDQGNRRVDVFSATGVFQGAFGWGVKTGDVAPFSLGFCTTVTGCVAGQTGSGAGQFESATGYPTVAPTSTTPHHLFVGNSASARIDEFAPVLTAGVVTGISYVRGVGVDTIPSGQPGDTGTGLEACTTASTCKAAVTGAAGFSPGNPVSVAADSQGAVYAVNRPTSGQCSATNVCRVMKFALDPTLAMSELAPATLTSTALNAAAQNNFDVAVDPGSDNVFVAKRASTSTFRIFEFNDQGGLVDSSLPNGGVLTTTTGPNHGLAVGSSGNLYFTNSAANAGLVNVLGQPPAPIATISPTADVGTTTATLRGKVTPPPGGYQTFYHFEYSTDGVNWTSAPNDHDIPVGSANTLVNVSQQVSGLQPNATYLVRLVATNGTATTSSNGVFITSAQAPSVSAVAADTITTDSARLTAKVNPNNQATTYRFEWGTNTSYGTRVPANFDAVAGSGGQPVKVTAEIDDLAPTSEYHFRLVATNSTGTTQGPDSTFTTLNAAGLANNRAYEQITPDAVNNVNEGGNANSAFTAAPDGQALAVCNIYPAGAQAPTGTCGGDYVTRRTTTGWHAKPVAPDFCAGDADSPDPGGRNWDAWLSVDLDRAVFVKPESASCVFPSLDPAAPVPSTNLYRADLLSDAFDLLAPAPGFGTPNVNNQAGYVTYNNGGVGASDDLGHVVYTSNGQQTPDAPVGSPVKLFEWDHGVLRLVSVKPDGSPFTNGVSLADPGLGGVSSSGDRVLFQNPEVINSNFLRLFAPAAATKLYMREGGTTTHDVSQSECTSSCGVAGYEVFRWATSDGSKVFFDSTEKLVDTDNSTVAAARDLYLYRHSANPVADQNLTLLSRDNEPADGISADVQGVLGMSDDGDTVYFAANGQIVVGAATAPGPKIYRWRWNGGSPTVDHLATLAVGAGTSSSCDFSYVDETKYFDETNWFCTEWRPDVRLVTPGGEYLMLDTIKRLDPGADSDADRDVYRWSASEGWRCVSCQAPGSPSAGASVIKGSAGSNTNNMSTRSRVPMFVSSDDGERVYFTSRDELAPNDVNGSVRDVYEWHNGVVTLISSGKSVKDNLLVATSRSGEDVFFMTDEALVGWDHDIVNDIYDARVGGGFAEPPTPPAGCDALADGCQGSGSPPADSRVETTSPSGDGDASPGERIELSVAGLSRKARVRASRRGTVPLAVRTTGAGTVSLSVRARLGKRVSRIGKATKPVDRAGRVTVEVRLSRAARKRLRNGKPLSIAIDVRQAGARTRTLTVRLPGVKS
jgi:hypothetical protein